MSCQHHLSEGVKRGFRTCLRVFESEAGRCFDDVFLDSVLVHKALTELDGKVAPSTWNLWLSRYQQYAKWLNRNKTPKLWKIEKKVIDWDEKLKDKWLSEEEVYRLLDVVDHPRAKAMYGVCVEGGLRAGELLSLKIRHCVSASYGFDITFSGKTGTRSVPIVLFAPLLRTWLNHHPAKHNPESPLWVRREGNVFAGIVYATANGEFKRMAKRAGIARNVSLHVLRHTKVTWTAKNKRVRISDKMANEMFGWTKNSAMFSRYTHLVGADSHDAFLALAGVKEVSEKVEGQTILSRRKCVGCGELNSAEALYCSRCSLVLNPEEASKVVEKQRILDFLYKKFREDMNKDSL